MKAKTFIAVSFAASIVVACNNGNNNSTDTATDSQSVVTATEEVAEDTPVAEETPATDSPAIKVETPQADNNLDGDVDKIVSQINEHIEVIQGLVDDGIPASSSMAFRAIEKLPDYSGELKKIKGKLTPEQKARIEAAEKKLKKVSDKWS